MSDEETIVTPTELMAGSPEYDIGKFVNIMKCKKSARITIGTR